MQHERHAARTLRANCLQHQPLRNQNRISQDKASRQVLFYVFFGYSGHALADLASSFTTLQLQHCWFTLLVWQASQAEHLQRLNFAESTCAEDLSVQHVYSLSVYPGLCSHLRTKDSQLTSAREELMDLRFDVELRAASLCRSQATLATEQVAAIAMYDLCSYLSEHLILFAYSSNLINWITSNLNYISSIHSYLILIIVFSFF